MISTSEESSKLENPVKIKKVSKLQFLVNLYNGKPGRDGDPIPEVPITVLKDLAVRLKEAEESHYFRVRENIKMERNSYKYLSETRWYIAFAKKKGLIVREQ